MLPGFCYSRLLWRFSGLQSAGLKNAGKAPIYASKRAVFAFYATFRFFAFEMSTLKIIRP